MALGRRVSRACWIVTPVVVIGGLAAALQAAPATGTTRGCPTMANARSFHGSVSTQFAQTAEGSDSIGGKLTVSLDRRTGAVFSSLTPVHGAGAQTFAFRGKPTLGAVAVINDGYVADDSPGPVTKGGQVEADARAKDSTATISIVGCTYFVAFSAEIATIASGAWPKPPDGSVNIIAVSPPETVPANGKLQGSATITWYRRATPLAGYYLTTGVPPGGSEWENTFSDVLAQGSQPNATATMTWGFIPAGLTRKK